MEPSKTVSLLDPPQQVRHGPTEHANSVLLRFLLGSQHVLVPPDLTVSLFDVFPAIECMKLIDRSEDLIIA